MALPQAFIAIEQTMAAAMHAEWDKLSDDILAQLQPAIDAKDWQQAHTLADQLTLTGVVSNVKGKIEEMCVSALLFGAHHVAGSVSATSYAQGEPLPVELQNAVSQLVEMVENDGADYVRDQLHDDITALQQQDETTHFQKDDVSAEQLAEDGGLQNPEQGLPKKRKNKLTKTEGPKTLYVNRPLTNAWELIAWAHTQGFKFVQKPEDMHVTLCYSKEPFDWDDLEPAQATVKVGEGRRALQQFGKPGEGCIVLEFESVDLLAEHEAFRAAGASYDFPTYRSHVTITWAGPPRPIEEIEPYRGPLIFGPQEFAPINNDWKLEHEEIQLRKADEKTLAEKLNDAVATGGKVAIDLGANLTTSRLVSLGFLAEAVKTGVETYRVNEVLDQRTCPVCRLMHGKTFKVAHEYGRVLQALSTSDPQELKAIAPWPSASKAGMAELQGLDADEMQTRGLGSPPYHPGCRGMLALTSSETKVTPATPAADFGALADAVDTLGDVTNWTKTRIATLQDAIGSIASEDLRTQAQAAFDAGLYDDAYSLAQTATGDGGVWTAPAIEQLKWERFDVTDADAFKRVDDAFNDGDYDKAKKLIEAWKSKQVSKADDDDPEKKRKNKPRGEEKAYDDVAPKGSSLAENTGLSPSVSNDNLAPLDRN